MTDVTRSVVESQREESWVTDVTQSLVEFQREESRVTDMTRSVSERSVPGDPTHLTRSVIEFQ